MNKIILLIIFIVLNFSSLVFASEKEEALESVGIYCDELPTLKSISKEIEQVKQIKGKSGYPDYVKLRHLDSQYYIVNEDIKERQQIYKSYFGKNLNPSVCKNRKYYDSELKKIRNQLLIEEK
ncbi:MAG: hypothetical protein ABSC11_08910 [Smithella sp.]|jgi:hypothetical protein